MTNDTLTAFEPQSLEQAIKVAEMISRSSLVPRALQGKPADILLVLWRGRELGLSSMQALGSINVIEGKTVMAAELQVALCTRRADICEYFTPIETSDTRATFETKRKGAPKAVQLSWTIEQAQKAGLLGKDNWKRHTASMLRWRASSALAKAVYPELVLGIYTPDEAEEIQGAIAQVLPAPVEVVPGAPALPAMPEPAKPTRTDEVKAKVRAKAQTVNVLPPGPSPWERLLASAKPYAISLDDLKALAKAETGKARPSELTDGDAVKVLAVLDAQAATRDVVMTVERDTAVAP